MGQHWMPTTDLGLQAFADNFSAKVTLAPTVYGLTVANALSLGVSLNSYSTSLATQGNPATRTTVTTNEKNVRKEALTAELRAFARVVQACLTVTDAQRISLGLPVRDTEPTPVPAPAVSPQMVLVSVTGHTVRVRLRNAQSPDSTARPANVAGAMVFSYVGATPPTNVDAWAFVANISKTTVDVNFEPEVASGATVWILASWFNSKMQTSPAASPITATLGGGYAMSA